ncbi:MAG: NAD(P)/FAD-dependent oxidoreductase [Alphaproteobacteria bacterium]
MTLYPRSYYADAVQAAPRPAFAGADTADVAVIGGGFTGLSAALHLAEAGTDAVLLEAARIGFAASGRNGGQMHSGFRKTQAELERWLGRERAFGLWEIAEQGKALIRDCVRKHAIDCAFTGGVIIAAHSRRAARALNEETEHLNTHYAYPSARPLSAEETNAIIGTRAYSGGQFDGGGGHMNPLAFALGLARAAGKAGARLFEESRVTRVEADANGVTLKLANGVLRAKAAILACDAFVPALAPELEPYLASVESHIVASEPLRPELKNSILKNGAAVADTRHVVDYYRLSEDGRLLFAGGEYLRGTPPDIFALVRPHLLRVFPQLRGVRLTHGWGGTVSITRTRMPQFGRLRRNAVFAHGYSGHGVALSVIGGKLLAQAALGKSEEFDLLASLPAKRFPGGPALRKPLVSAALFVLKWADKF